jgi:sterol desaturase/sphingolipid hydroxylase (fatty acid hydroxylase superfamily)
MPHIWSGSLPLNLVGAFGAIGLLAAGHYWPRFPQRLLRDGWVADLLHALVNGVVLHLILAAFLRNLSFGIDQSLGSQYLRVLSMMPLWGQGVVLLIAGDLLKWVTHRVQHAIPALWRLHRLHHSSRELDALSHGREHPIECLINRLPFLVIFVVILGIDLRLIAIFSAVDLLQGLWAHSNTHVRVPWLNYVFATQEFHHWHHADTPDAFDKNFGGFLSIWDWVFRTAYCPRDREITGFGLAEVKPPRSYWKQILLKF